MTWLILITIFILFFAITSRVITRLRRTRDALNLSRDRLEAVTQTIGVGLAIISKDYTTLWANKVLKDFAGSIEGVRCFYTLLQRKEICDGCGLKEIFQTGKERISIEQYGKDPNGNQLWFQIIATPITDNKGNVTSVLEMFIPITERKKAEHEREKLIKELESALSEVKTLSGLLPICANCKKIRDDKGYWNMLESYIVDRTDATFTHGICPDCKRQLYPELFEDK